jgi:hypothetical protein
MVMLISISLGVFLLCKNSAPLILTMKNCPCPIIIKIIQQILKASKFSSLQPLLPSTWTQNPILSALNLGMSVYCLETFPCETSSDAENPFCQLAGHARPCCFHFCVQFSVHAQPHLVQVQVPAAWKTRPFLASFSREVIVSLIVSRRTRGAIMWAREKIDMSSH